MYKSLSHSHWDCKYHMVFVTNYRRKNLFDSIRNPHAQIGNKLAWKKSLILSKDTNVN
jgi:REP element-mobilizing transposase RayT